ncbi:MAG: MFS transporter [Chloroflexi bacterium]|nr:MFS transporter [Chloroflexota bacterium]
MPQWRRTLYTVWVTQFIGVAGFSFVTPFIAYYVQELGVTGVKEVALWAGLVTSAQAVSMAVMSPIWGALADRYGRKLMVLRASFAGAVILTLMGFVTNVQQLVLLRFIQGMLTGTVAATTTLVASTVPKERSGMALGSLQMAVFLGVSLGPLLGGLSGDTFGYRPSFWVTGALLLISGILVAVFVKEDFHPAADVAEGGLRRYGHALKLVLASTALLATFAARILLRVGSRSLDPILPLFIQSLMPGAGHVGTTAGIVAAVSALGAAAGSPLIGGWGDRLGYRRLLIASAVAAALGFIPQAFVQDPRWLIFWQLLSGFAVGGTLSTLTAMMANLTERGREGMVFGLDASAVSAGNALGPILGATAAGELGLRAPFLVASLMFGIGAAAVVVWVRDGSRTRMNTEAQG